MMRIRGYGNTNEPSSIHSFWKTKTMKIRLAVALTTALFLSAGQYLARGEEPVLSRAVQVSFTVELNSLKLNGFTPGGVALAGSASPLKSESARPPAVILRPVKSDVDAYSALVQFPKGTRCDLEFSFLLRVEGIWQKEVNNSDIQHVVLLDPAEESQVITCVFDSTTGRIVAKRGTGTKIDDYVQASSIAQEAKDLATARRYEYAAAVSLLALGRVSEAKTAYDRYVAASPAGTLAREEYDRFHILEARILQNTGKSADAIGSLRAVPRAEGSDAYQAGIGMALGGILEKSGDRAGARSAYYDVLRRLKLDQGLKEQCLGRIAHSYVVETSQDSIARGKEMLRQLASTSTRAATKRWSLLALATTERKTGNAPGELAALKAAGVLGTNEQRLAVKMQILEKQYRERDYEGIHKTCDWILTDGQPGNQLPHLLYLDAVALKRLGRDAESKRVLEKLYEGFPGNAYAEYAASLLGAPVYEIPADTLSKGGTVR